MKGVAADEAKVPLSLRRKLGAVFLEQDLGETVHRPQRGAQIVRYGIGEGFQFAVGGFQLRRAQEYTLLQFRVQPADLLLCLEPFRDVLGGAAYGQEPAVGRVHRIAEGVQDANLAVRAFDPEVKIDAGAFRKGPLGLALDHREVLGQHEGREHLHAGLNFVGRQAVGSKSPSDQLRRWLRPPLPVSQVGKVLRLLEHSFAADEFVYSIRSRWV